MRDAYNKTPIGAAAARGRAEDLAATVRALAISEGPTATAWPWLSVYRFSSGFSRRPILYVPSLCVVVQGRKRAYLGNESFTYDPLHYLVVTLTLPLEAEIVRASSEKPLLALVLEIDLAAVGRLLVDLDEEAGVFPRNGCRPPALFVSKMDADMQEALGRMLRAVSKPQDLKVLGPSLNREILYRVLCGEQGDVLRTLALRDGATHRIARIVRHLNDHSHEPLTIDDIAHRSGMSAAVLHRTFREVTGMSPFQYIKRTRLLKARPMLLEQGPDAGEAGFRDGSANRPR